MTDFALLRRRLPRAVVALTLLAGVIACSSRSDPGPPDPARADVFLYERGMDSLSRRQWADAREYFRRLIEDYPGSPRRADAKLGVGDSYLGEKSASSLVYAANEYREFLQFYPTHTRGDYAQYQRAMTYFQQMRSPEHDQTPTRQALAEFDVFFARYPDSALTPEARSNWRIARDRLSDYSFGVGRGYFRRRWFPGAIDRFREILKEDPGYSRMDAVYYHLAESLVRTDNKAEAVPLYARLIQEYETSEYVGRAQERLKELQLSNLGGLSGSDGGRSRRADP